MAYGYYPGCSLHATAAEYDKSMKAVCRTINVELDEVNDWNCCGATPAHTTKQELGIALPYSNLINASEQGLSNLIAPCAACYNRLKTADHEVAHSPHIKERMLEITGKQKESEINIYNILEFFKDIYGLEKLKAEVKRPLTGIKAASYYGCLLVRPSKILNFDDAEDPRYMDEIIESIGAAPVSWSCKTECCGGSLAFPKTEIVLDLGMKIFRSAQNAGADCIVVACPLCHANLDMRQKQINKIYGTDFRMPVFYITQLIGLALNIKADELGVNKHFIKTADFLKDFSLN